MLLDPFCFVTFVETSGEEIVEYIDSWAEGQKPIYHFFGDLVIDMRECIYVDVAKIYLQKLNLPHLINRLKDLDCPCNN
jgi:uncharacterized protein (DUF1015 family)